MQIFTILGKELRFLFLMQLDRKLYFYYYRDFHLHFESYELGSMSKFILYISIMIFISLVCGIPYAINGMWMSPCPVIGYDIPWRSMIINQYKVIINTVLLF